MNIENAKYQTSDIDSSVNTAVVATVDGTTYTIPLDPANTHYAEIQRQVAAGELTIADAD